MPEYYARFQFPLKVYFDISGHFITRQIEIEPLQYAISRLGRYMLFFIRETLFGLQFRHAMFSVTTISLLSPLLVLSPVRVISHYGDSRRRDMPSLSASADEYFYLLLADDEVEPEVCRAYVVRYVRRDLECFSPLIILRMARMGQKDTRVYFSHAAFSYWSTI